MRDELFIEIEKTLKNDKDVMILTADLGFGIFEKIEKKYPKQFINVGVAEQNLIGVGSGLASEGKFIIVYSIANFPIVRCLEQIRNDAAYHNINMLIISCGAGFTYGQLGVSHHLTEDIAIMNSIPNVEIFSPSSNSETRYLFNKIVRKKGVSYLRIDKRGVEFKSSNLKDYNNPLLVQKGKNILIISTGTILEESIKASSLIKKKFDYTPTILSINNFNYKYLKGILKYIKGHSVLITLEEHNINGGMGSIINNFLMKNKKYISDIDVKNIGIDNKFCSKIGDQKYLRKINNIDYLSILKIVK